MILQDDSTGGDEQLKEADIDGESAHLGGEPSRSALFFSALVSKHGGWMRILSPAKATVAQQRGDIFSFHICSFP